MKVTLQYFDGCPNWRATELLLRQLQAEADFALELQRIGSEEQAQEVGFHGSPTVLVDGADPFATPRAPVAWACRVYPTPNGLAGSPSLEQLRDALGMPPPRG